jgi:hypothetical protein
MNQYGIERPIGLDNICSEIEQICADAHVYKRCGLMPGNFIVELDSGNGRTVVMEYAVDMFKAAGVLPFSSGLDDYISLKFDGSLQQFKTCKNVIDSAAVYKNTYQELYEVDCIALASHASETQYKEFFRLFSDICGHACVFFFVPTQLSKNEERFVEKLKESFEDVKRIAPNEYTVEELTLIIEKSICDHGIEIERPKRVTSVLRSIVALYKISSVKDALSFATLAVRHADFSGFKPTIDDKCMKALVEGTSFEDAYMRRDVK